MTKEKTSLEGMAATEKVFIIPRFEDFEITEIFEGRPALVDLTSHTDASRFRTALIEGAKGGPNFTGHITIVSWGYGTMCQIVAAVDAKTDAVYFGPTTAMRSEFRIDSNLFIVNSPDKITKIFDGFDAPEWVYTAYYKWENNQFINT